jgi:radical SAM superfamily enzyme YgiQ (UPF0313 family)
MNSFVYPINEENRDGPVVLISKKISYTFPLGYAYLAGYLQEKGEPIEVLFRPSNRSERKEFVENIIRKKPVIVALGGLFPELEEIREWIELFSLVQRNFPIVIGGQMVSPTPELAMEKAKADFGVIGEGEIVLHELVLALRTHSDISKIGGLIIRTDTGFLKTGAGKIIEDLSLLPKIPFDLFPQEEWLPIGEWYCQNIPQAHWYYSDRVIPVHGGRGCPYRCNFCYHHSKPRFRPIPDMIAEAKDALILYRGNYLYFGDDLVISTPERAKQLVEELSKNKLEVSYHISTRFDILSKLDDNLLTQIKKSGCRAMGIGVESGSDRILKIIGKNCTSADIIAQLKRLKDVGIIPTLSIMIGQYTETKEDVEQSIKLMQTVVRENPHINFAFTITTPFPGSRLYELIFKKGLLQNEQEYYDRYFFGDYKLGDWNQIVNMSEMTNDEVLQMHNLITQIYIEEKRAALGYKIIIYEKIFKRVCKCYIIFRSILPTQGFFSRQTKYLTLHIEKILIALDKKRLKYRGINPDTQ